ncbi:MAG: type II restriction endonuclease, partial [Bacilli bacterium]
MYNKTNISNDFTVEEAWDELLVKYNIVEEIEKNGVFEIKASQIKEFKEPRLMSKWDSTEQLPAPLKKNKINILPNSRSSYVLGDFLLYEEIPELKEHITKMPTVELPNYETIDIDAITSEANAINVLILSKILDDFLSTNANAGTFNGRMGTGVFEFKVNTVRNVSRNIIVNNAQCEIDGGFENDESVVILEAKNVVHEDFHVRQLYYPYRLWATKVKKPIRLVFSIYSNKIFRLFEYEFENINDYSSIKLIQSKNYSLQDTSITIEELQSVKQKTKIKYDDNMLDEKLPPFIQADSFDRVISLLENMYDNPMNDEEVAELMHFGSNLSNGRPSFRQSQYYINAGRYLGLFEKQKDEDKHVVSCLSKLGKKVYKLQYKERQLQLVSLILEHRIFNELFDYVINNGDIPNKELVKDRMRELNVCQESQIDRRSTSVRRWL